RGDPAPVLSLVRPQAREYRYLVEALGRYRRVMEAGGYPVLRAGPPLALGDRGARVGELRARLVAEGDPHEAPLAAAAPEGPEAFDRHLQAAVQHFQRRHGLADDGVVGPATTAALRVSAHTHVETIRL